MSLRQATTLIVGVMMLWLPAEAQGVSPEQRQLILSQLVDQDPFVRTGAMEDVLRYQIVEAIPIIESRFWIELTHISWHLHALEILRCPNLCAYARAVADSARYIERTLNRPGTYLRYRVDASYYLFKCGDYSTAPDVIAGIRSGDRLSEDFRLLIEIVKHVPAYADTAKAELIRIAGEGVLPIDRANAVRDLLELYGEGALPQLVHMFTSDADPLGSNRYVAFSELSRRNYSDLNALLRQQLRRETAWVYRIDYADTLLYRFGSPSDYAFVEEYCSQAPEPREKRHINRSLDDFRPPVIPASMSISQALQNINNLVHEVSSRNWVGGQVFVDELDQYLSNARDKLNVGDQIASARLIRTFQTRVDDEFRDSLDNDNKFVTVEAWKFLYYNGQYILDRLPAIPPSPVLSSLNPTTAFAGGNGFTLTVNGKAFVPASAVLWNGSSHSTSFVADSVLQATVLASDIVASGTARVAVVNPGNDTSNSALFTIAAPGLAVKIINSVGSNLTGGSLQYYDGSWKDAVNNNDGTFRVSTTLATVSLRLTYEGGSQTKSNMAVGPDVVVFQTVNTQVKLQNSTGSLIDTGTVQYYYSSWKTFGTTTNGVATKELLPASYTFRMTYATATNDKQQDIGANHMVVFNTVNASIQLKNSAGNLMDQGTVQYYFSSWQNLGTTSNGVAAKELLPGSYTFRMAYASATNDKQQNISSNPTVVFQTVNAAVQLQNSQGALIDTGTVQYYFSSWQNLGTTTSGVATKELLPANYTFRMSYASATKDKQQNIGTNPTVVFNTVNAAVQLKNSQGALIDQGTVQYYFSSWKTLGSTTNGVATKELLPGSYTFRMTYETVTNDKVQDISTNSTVSFSTVLCTVTVKNGQGQPVDGAQVSYYFSSWRSIGATVGGQVTKELLPASITFRETIGSATQNKMQNIGTNALVEFVTQ